MKKIAFVLLIGASVSGCAAFRPNNLADAALRHEGKNARQMGVSPSLWCADAANIWRKEAGFRPTGSRRAIDQLAYARPIRVAERGALQITPRGRGGNHVDVVLENHGDGTLTVIGGNVGGAVTRRVVYASGRFVIPLREGEQTWRVFK